MGVGPAGPSFRETWNKFAGLFSSILGAETFCAKEAFFLTKQNVGLSEEKQTCKQIKTTLF